MVVVKIRAGLGNQMFQYAFTKALEAKGYAVKIDTSFKKTFITGDYQLDKYNIDLTSSTDKENNRYRSLVPKFLRKTFIYKPKIIRERSFLYDERFLNVEDDKYLIGFFQSEKYFKHIRSTLIEQFTLNVPLSRYSQEIESQIQKSTNSCSIHVRRGDYLSERYVHTHNVCTVEYYNNAVQYMQSKQQELTYFVFSDDIDWAKENIQIDNAVYIDSEEERIPHEDIHLMSRCKHNIVANSTFSWWGAWLNENNDKIVIAPKQWFLDEKLQAESVDIPCADWIRVEFG